MKNNNARPVGGAILTISLTAMLCACSSMPSVRDVQVVDLHTVYVAPYQPVVDVDGDPETRPGNMAHEALVGSMECDILFLFCAIVTVPVAAVAGAAITAADTLPEDLAEELNDITVRAARRVNLPGMFDDAMRAAAVRQGLDVQSMNADAELEIAATELWWEVSVGDQVSLRLTVEVSASRDGKVGRRRLGYRGEAAPVEEWLAFDGRRIREALESFMDDAGDAVWRRLLQRDQD